ncbi:MAG: hypothetical protein AAF986_08350 [Pseudomonadota bacterium]
MGVDVAVAVFGECEAKLWFEIDIVASTQDLSGSTVTDFGRHLGVELVF